MTAERVVDIIQRLNAASIPAWITGGWGIDALLGHQTRPHRDLDLAVDARREAETLALLVTLGYRIETDWRPIRVEVANGEDWVDIHPLVFQGDDSGVQAGPDNRVFTYPAADLTHGTIADARVPCISTRLQREFHSGYEPRAHDLHDLALLDTLRNTAPE